MEIFLCFPRYGYGNRERDRQKGDSEGRRLSYTGRECWKNQTNKTLSPLYFGNCFLSISQILYSNLQNPTNPTFFWYFWQYLLGLVPIHATIHANSWYIKEIQRLIRMNLSVVNNNCLFHFAWWGLNIELDFMTTITG